jgi:hypothetical protein
MKRLLFFYILFVSISGLVLHSCDREENLQVEQLDLPDTLSDGNDGKKIFITDKTGKRWDITHAVDTYGMNPSRFRFGLGPDAIRPINNPQFITSSDPNFPVSNGQFAVIGVNFSGDARAYPIRALTNREVVNDRSGSIAFAPVY